MTAGREESPRDDRRLVVNNIFWEVRKGKKYVYHELGQR